MLNTKCKSPTKDNVYVVGVGEGRGGEGRGCGAGLHAEHHVISQAAIA